ncbi:MAG: hypothetical protein WBC97_00920 [Gemmatimonadales bacterium]
MLALLVSAALPAKAQADPDSVKLRNDCRRYRQVLTTGKPAPHRAEALERVNLCQDAPSIFVDWLGSLSSATNPDQFADFRSEVSGVRDGLVFAKALATSQDRGGSPTARVVALLVVLDQQGYSWSAAFTNVITRGKYCALAPASGVDTRVLTPLPSDYLDQSIAVSARIASDVNEPTPVRNAAACVHRYLVLRNTLYRDDPPALHP